MTLEQAQSLIGDTWAAYDAAGKPYGPIRLGMLRWAEELMGWEVHRQLDYALKVESRHLEKMQ